MSFFSKLYSTLWVICLSFFAALLSYDIPLPYFIDHKQNEYISVIVLDKHEYKECDLNYCSTKYELNIYNQNNNYVNISVSPSVYNSSIIGVSIKFKRYIVENKIENQYSKYYYYIFSIFVFLLFTGFFVFCLTYLNGRFQWQQKK